MTASISGRGRRDPRHRRRERRRQVDVDEDPLRHASARRGAHAGARRRGPFHLPQRRHRHGHRHGAPALHAGRQPDRARERDPRLGADARRSTGSTSTTPARTSREVGEAYGLDVDPDELVETLEVGERQRIEIIKVLYRGAKILILDEPTAVLVPQEVEALFDNLRELKASGSTILFIDHKLLRGARDRRHASPSCVRARRWRRSSRRT